MILMAGDVAPDRRDEPTSSDPIEDDGLGRAMALGHLDIQPFEHGKGASGTYELGFAAHDATSARHDGERLGAARGISIEPGATATVESLEFLELSPSIMARLWVATWTLHEGLRISAERLLPPRFRGRVCAYVTNIGRSAVTLPPRAPLIAVEVHFLSDARSRHEIAPSRLGGEPSARALESASRGCSAGRDTGTTVRIDDLGPMPFALRQAILVGLREGAEEFRARFADADIEITGATPEEAIANLKSLIVATYEDLVDADSSLLDHRQRRQRRVLEDLLRYDGAAEV
jgi:hypothetical protein